VADPLQLVIDANVLVAAFLKAATTRNLLLDERLKLYSPEYLLIEAKKVLKSRLAKSWQGFPGLDFDQLFAILTDGITVLPKEDYAPFLGKASEIAPHEEDSPYLACALKLGIPLWSNDSGMGNQTLVKVFTTEKLLAELAKR